MLSAASAAASWAAFLFLARSCSRSNRRRRQVRPEAVTFALTFVVVVVVVVGRFASDVDVAVSVAVVRFYCTINDCTSWQICTVRSVYELAGEPVFGPAVEDAWLDLDLDCGPVNGQAGSTQLRLHFVPALAIGMSNRLNGNRRLALWTIKQIDRVKCMTCARRTYIGICLCCTFFILFS